MFLSLLKKLLLTSHARIGVIVVCLIKITVLGDYQPNLLETHEVRGSPTSMVK